MAKKTLNFLTYGTLREGMHNNRVISGYEREITTCRLPGFVMFTNESFPYVFPTGREEDVITVELVKFTNPSEFEYVMSGMDMLEGYHGPQSPSNHYDRHEIGLEMDGEVVDAYIYIPNPALVSEIVRLRQIKHGDFVRDYVEKRPSR